MTPDLNMLVSAAALALVQMFVAVAGAQLQVGLPMLAGNRESLPELTGYVAFAGDIPIARVKLVPQHYRVRHPAIME